LQSRQLLLSLLLHILWRRQGEALGPSYPFAVEISVIGWVKSLCETHVSDLDERFGLVRRRKKDIFCS
jgi:hypothetical protein